MVTGADKPRNPKASPLYQCVKTHFAEFEASYPTRYQEQYGFYRPVIGRVLEKFLGCGDLTKGLARVRCDSCRHEYLLAFSCKGRYFCPSCHQKRVLQFGSWVTEEVLASVPHRQYVFTIPKMLRGYFRKDRRLLGKLRNSYHHHPIPITPNSYHPPIDAPWLDTAVTAMGVRVLRTPVRAPTATAVCERLLGSLRRECLDFLIPLTETHLRRILQGWRTHYHRGRPHTSLGPGIPHPPAGLPAPPFIGHRLPAHSRVVSRSVLGGLHWNWRRDQLFSFAHYRGGARF